jgi:hypothetical protein
MTEEVMKIAKLFQITAYQLRRLGRGPIEKDHSSLGVMEAYEFNNKIRTTAAFPRDICFETANLLEEFARKLEVVGKPRHLHS